MDNAGSTPAAGSRPSSNDAKGHVLGGSMATMCMGYRSPLICNRCNKLAEDTADELSKEWVKIRQDRESTECVYFFDKKDRP